MQAFYATLWHALLRLDNNRHRLFVVDSSEKGFGVKKPDLALSTVPEKLPAYVVYTASLNKLIIPGGLPHEVVSQCNERMQSLLLPQQPERDRFFALAGGADGVELWSWKSKTEEYRATGILPLNWDKHSDGLQLLVRLACTSPGSLGFRSFTRPAVMVDGVPLEEVRRLDAGDCFIRFPNKKSSSSVLVGLLGKKSVVAKKSFHIEKEVSCL